MKELLIKIKALFEGTGATDAANAIKKVGTEADQAHGKLGGLDSIFGKLSTSAKLWAAGLTAGAATAIVGFVRSAVEAFAAAEVAQSRLDAALANSGLLTDAYREKLAKLASVRSQATGIDDEKFLGVFTTLTKFGADTGNIDRYTRAVENLAGFLGGDMEQAAFLFGKAMQGSTEMLGRYGIEVDKTKSQTEQLADIMRQLEARGGGQLEAMGNTLEGSINKAKNAWENFLESLGSAAESSGLSKRLADWAAGVEIIAEKLGGGASAPKQKNREELIGSTVDAQNQADEISRAKRSLEESRRVIQEDQGKAFSGLAPEYDEKGYKTLLSGIDKERNAALQERIAGNDRILEQITAELSALEQRSKLLGLRTGSPEEAQNARNALNPSGQEYGPAGDPEAIAAAEKYFEKLEVERSKEEAASAKAQRETDRKSQAASDAYEKEEQIRQSKSDQLDLETRITEAKAAGNSDEVRKLEWLREYNRLLAEGAREDQAQRAANAASAENGAAGGMGANPSGTRTGVGEVFPGTNRRRGAIESDAMGENALNLAPGQSLLDQYKQNRSRAVGAVGGQSILPDDPTSSVDASGNAVAGKDGKSGGAEDAAKKLADTLKKELDGVKKALGDATKATDNSQVLAAVSALGSAIKTADSNLQAQIDALASQI